MPLIRLPHQHAIPALALGGEQPPDPREQLSRVGLDTAPGQNALYQINSAIGAARGQPVDVTAPSGVALALAQADAYRPVPRRELVVAEIDAVWHRQGALKPGGVEQEPKQVRRLLLVEAHRQERSRRPIAPRERQRQLGHARALKALATIHRERL